MDAASLRELQDRGRCSSERCPGAAAAAEQKRERQRAERDKKQRRATAAALRRGERRGRHAIFLARHVVHAVAGNPPQTAPA